MISDCNKVSGARKAEESERIKRLFESKQGAFNALARKVSMIRSLDQDPGLDVLKSLAAGGDDPAGSCLPQQMNARETNSALQY